MADARLVEPQIPEVAVVNALRESDYSDLIPLEFVAEVARIAVNAARPALREQWRVGAFEAGSVLAELVSLRDGPRDGAYRTAKDLAWARARAVLTSTAADRINEWRRPMPDISDPMPVFVIKGQDQLAVSTIECYRTYCEDKGLIDQAEEVGKAIAEIQAWQQRNPDAVKLPDHPHVPAGAPTDDGDKP